MKDYQVLIDHAWSLNPDLFEMFREHFQEELDKRRPFIKEFQENLLKKDLSEEQIDAFFTDSKQNCMRTLLPTKISRSKEPLHPSTGPWMTPIDTIHR